MIINRIYENKNLLSLYLVSFLVGLRTYQQPCTKYAFRLGILNDLRDVIEVLWIKYESWTRVYNLISCVKHTKIRR